MVCLVRYPEWFTDAAGMETTGAVWASLVQGPREELREQILE